MLQSSQEKPKDQHTTPHVGGWRWEHYLTLALWGAIMVEILPGRTLLRLPLGLVVVGNYWPVVNPPTAPVQPSTILLYLADLTPELGI